MKNLFLSLITFLLCSTLCMAQSHGVVLRLRTMQPASDIFNASVSNGSFGLNFGYGNVFKGSRVGIDLTAFGDLMDYKFYFGDDKRFDGSTIFTGLAVGSSYCFNPKGYMQFTVALSVKGGYNFGSGTVYRYKLLQVNEDERIEDKSAKGVIGTAFSPYLAVQFPVDFGHLGIELGYDSSDYGAGIRRLRSAYYPPIGYHSGYLFAGVFFRFQN